jgi:putative addiction module antidote
VYRTRDWKIAQDVQFFTSSDAIAQELHPEAPHQRGFFPGERTISAACGSARGGITFVITRFRRDTAMKLKITSIGNSAGVILPRELLARLHVAKGDELYAIETPDGVRLSVFDPKLSEQMEVAEKVMRQRRTLLHKLAQ